MNIIKAEFLRQNLKFKIEELESCCTMNETVEYCNLFGKKFPKLEELYFKLFNSKIIGAHDALIDTVATKKCYFELIKQNVIKPKFPFKSSLLDLNENLAITFPLKMFPFRKDKKWGVSNQRKEMIIECDYQQIISVSKYFISVRKNYKTGYFKWIDNHFSGPYFCENYRIHFNENVAPIKIQGTFTLINEAGNSITDRKLDYDSIGEFNDGIALISINIKIKHRDLLKESREGNFIPSCEESMADILSSNEEIEKLNGFIDKTGREIVPCIYESANAFSENLAGVYINGKWGFINVYGKLELPNIYDKVEQFHNGHCKVRLGNLWGLIDKKGSWVLECIYEDLSFYEEDMIVVFKLNAHYGFKNLNANISSKCIYDAVSKFNDGLAVIRLKYKHGFINMYAEEVVSPTYSEAFDFRENLALVVKNSKYYFIDKKGLVVITIENVDPGFQNIIFGKNYNISYNATGFCEGYARIVRDGKVGFIGKTGDDAIPCIFDFAHDFKDGLACVEIDRKWGFINKAGNPIIPCKYASFEFDFSDQYNYGPEWKDELMAVYGDNSNGPLGNLLGYIDKNGEEYWVD